MAFIAYDIEWSADMDEIYEVLDDMTCEGAAATLGIPKRTYANMTSGERHDYAYEFYRRRPGAIDDLFNLPSKVNIPEEIDNEDDIADWLSDTYGFCINSYLVRRK